MSIDLSPLNGVRRLLLEVPLEPLQGARFQPTGFPDLGPAMYQAGETDCLLVESAQSMANRLELQIWDEGKQELKDCCKGMSYVRVNQRGAFLTSSVLEAHRINSVYIEKSDGDFFAKTFAEEMGVDKKNPVNRRKYIAALFKYDVNSLLHGCFVESLDGRIRVSRAISAFIEAEHTSVVASGGVKNDRIQASKDKDGEADAKTAKEGFGNVPFARQEFTAAEITAYFSFDLEQIRGYGLPDSATRLLILLALFKVRSLLDGSLRLRTACDLAMKQGYDFTARKPDSFRLPPLDALTAELKQAVEACAAEGLFGGENGVTTVVFTGASGKAKKSKGKGNAPEAAEPESEADGE